MLPGNDIVINNLESVSIEETKKGNLRITGVQEKVWLVKNPILDYLLHGSFKNISYDTPLIVNYATFIVSAIARKSGDITFSVEYTGVIAHYRPINSTQKPLMLLSLKSNKQL